MYQHAIDNFKLIAEIHVLACETFKTKLCWERSKKILRVKKHRSASKPLHNWAIDATFLFAIMITLTCTCTFAWGDDYSYPVVSYKFLKDEISFLWKRIFVSSKWYFVSPKRSLASSKRNFVLMTRNFVHRARNFATKFRLMPRIFVSIITLLAKFRRH